jgi:hypothetical protein
VAEVSSGLEPRDRNDVLPVIQMFWHGSPLSRVERLSIASFLHHGHPVELYVYEEPPRVPQGLRLRDAAEILPKKYLFRHRKTKSLGMFADWFRYRLLFERGGLWSDADMVCLKPFDYPATEVFAWQDEQFINNAVLGLRAGDPLAKWMAEVCEHPNRWLPYDEWSFRLRKLKRRFLQGNRRSWVRWGESGPMGLTRAARHFGYTDRALPSWHFYPVSYQNFGILFESPPAGRNGFDFGESRAVHLWNNLLVLRGGPSKDSRFAPDSPFERLCARYLPDET